MIGQIAYALRIDFVSTDMARAQAAVYKENRRGKDRMRNLGPRIGDAIWDGWTVIALRLARHLNNHRDALSYYRDGRHALAAGHYQRALLDARCAIEANPNLWQGYHLLSSIYLTARDFQRAKEAALQGLAVDPQAALLYSVLGDAETNFGRYPEAEAAYRRGLDLLPPSADIETRFYIADMLLRIGTVIRRQHRPQDAAQVLRESLALRPGHSITLMELAETYKNRRDHEAALPILFEAIKADPANAAAHYHLAENMIAIRRFLDAREHARKAVAIEPANARYREILEATEKMVEFSGNDS